MQAPKICLNLWYQTIKANKKKRSKQIKKNQKKRLKHMKSKTNTN